MKTKKNKDVVKKHHALIQTKASSLSLVQRKVFNYFLAIAQIEGDKKGYTSKLSEVIKLCKVSPDDYPSLKKNIRGLMSQVVEFEYTDPYEGETWEACVLMDKVKVTPQTGKIYFQIQEDLKQKILYPDRYAPIDLPIIARLRSKYSVILYEFLKVYLNSKGIPVPVLEIEEFRRLMNIPEGRYKKIGDLKINIIDKSKKEINTLTDLNCDYALQAGLRPNKFEFIKFTVEKKKRFEPLKEELEQTILFENLLPVGKLTPEEIKKYLPFDHSTPEVFKIINAWKNPTPAEPIEEVLISNLEYAKDSYKENYPNYLRLCLKNDWAKEVRQAEQLKKEKEFKRKAMEEAKQRAEAEQIKAKKEQEKKDEALIKSLSKKEYNALYAIAEKEVMTHEGVKYASQERIKTWIESEMVKLKRSQLKEVELKT